MKLANPPAGYSPTAEQERNRAISQADKENHKRNRDLEVGVARLILTSPNGTRWNVAVSDAGTITATAL